MTFYTILGWGGLASCALGGLLALVSVSKGRQARQLSGVVQVDNLGELKQLVALVPLLVAVTGRVLATKPYRCEMSDSEAAIVEFREEKKMERRSGNVWISDSQLLREAVRETSWALADGSGVELPVEAGRRAEGDFLQMSGDRLIPEPQSSHIGRLMEEVGVTRNLGVRQSERMLPLGTLLTAVGELALAVEHPLAFQGAIKTNGKMLVLRQPLDGPFRLLSRQSLPELIVSLQAGAHACQQWAVAFTAVGASMLVASAAHQALLYMRQRRIRQQVDKRLREREAAAAARRGNAADGPAPAADDLPDASAAVDASRHLCVVCLERRLETVFPGCGHMCTCSRCSVGLNRCPICRTRGAPIRVYTA